LGSAPLIPDEDLGEFIFAAAPLLARLALAPTLGSLYWLYRPVAPRLSLSMLLLGGLGLSAFVLLPVLYVLSDTLAAPDPDLRPLLLLWYGLMLANGLWQIVAGVIEMMWPLLPDAWFGVSGIAGGISWMVFFLCILSLSWPLPGPLVFLLWLNLPFLLMAQGIWVANTAYWLLTYTGQAVGAPTRR